MSRKTDPTTRINELASILKISHRKPTEEETPAPLVEPDPGQATPPILREPADTAAPPPAAVKAMAPIAPAEAPAPPSPAPPRGKGGKSSDKQNFVYKGLYLRKVTEKKAKRRLEDLETGQDFSELVEELLTRWLEETN